MLVVSVALVFGSGMPLCYPIAMCVFVSAALVERIALTRSYVVTTRYNKKVGSVLHAGRGHMCGVLCCVVPVMGAMELRAGVGVDACITNTLVSPRHAGVRLRCATSACSSIPPSHISVSLCHCWSPVAGDGDRPAAVGTAGALRIWHLDAHLLQGWYGCLPSNRFTDMCAHMGVCMGVISIAVRCGVVWCDVHCWVGCVQELHCAVWVGAKRCVWYVPLFLAPTISF